MLNVHMDVNGAGIQPILHIHRLDEFDGAHEYYRYETWISYSESSPRPEEHRIAQFRHYYDDGALVCAALAVRALHEAGLATTTPRTYSERTPNNRNGEWYE